MTSPCKGIQSKESTPAIESVSCRVSSCMAHISTGTYGHFICTYVRTSAADAVAAAAKSATCALQTLVGPVHGVGWSCS